MIILNGAASNGDQLLLNSNSAGFANIAVHCSYVDYNGANQLITPAATDTFISANVANQVIVANVANANNSRNIKTVVIHNANASATNTVVVLVANGAANANLYTLYSYILQPGETLQYFDTGWQILNAQGQIKVTPTPSSGLLQSLTVHTANATHTTGANTNTVHVRMIGGGGGGAGVAGNSSNQAYGGGGAAGGYTEWTTPVAPSANYTVVVGAGGTAGANNANGGAGANSNWTGNLSNSTVVWTAQGGAGGVNMANGATVAQSLGGVQTPANTANSPQISAGGQAGGPSYRINGTAGFSGSGGCADGIGGAGGASIIQSAATAGTVGGAAANFGSGGGGAGGNSNANGGAGSVGCIVVEEYS